MILRELRPIILSPRPRVMKSNNQRTIEGYLAPEVELLSFCCEEGFAASQTPDYEEDGEIEV